MVVPAAGAARHHPRTPPGRTGTPPLRWPARPACSAETVPMTEWCSCGRRNNAGRSLNASQSIAARSCSRGAAGGAAPSARSASKHMVQHQLLEGHRLPISSASITTWPLAIVGMLVASGILLLLWVCWKMARAPDPGLRFARRLRGMAHAAVAGPHDPAVAGAARERATVVLVFGLVVPLPLMAAAPPSSPACSGAAAGSPMSAWRSRCMLR
jgi:hypothetical protein